MNNEEKEKFVRSIIGKTLAEVKQLHPYVRIIYAGPVRFVQTRDFREDRLNVGLDEKSLSFKEEMVLHRGEEYKKVVVDGSMENGVVVYANFG